MGSFGTWVPSWTRKERSDCYTLLKAIRLFSHIIKIGILLPSNTELFLNALVHVLPPPHHSRHHYSFNIVSIVPPYKPLYSNNQGCRIPILLTDLRMNYADTCVILTWDQAFSYDRQYIWAVNVWFCPNGWNILTDDDWWRGYSRNVSN